nr:AhpC/TSA family protein [Saprospiraceae bacterium]
MNVLFIFLLGAAVAACSGESKANHDSNQDNPTALELNNELLEGFDPGKHIPQGLTPTYSDRTRISVEVENFTQGGEAVLIGYFGENRYRAAAAPIDENGRFVFEQDEPFREGIYVVALPNNQGFQISLAERQMDFSLKTQNRRLVESLEVSNSLENELMAAVAQYENTNRSQIDSVNRIMDNLEEGTEEYKEEETARLRLAAERRAVINSLTHYYPDALYASFKVAGQNPEVRRDLVLEDGSPNTRKQAYHFRNEFWDSVDFSDERLLNTPVIINMLKRYMDELVPQNADSINKYSNLLVDQVLDHPTYFQFFANWITNNFDSKNTTIMDPQAIFVNMIQNYFTYERAFWSDSANIYGLQQRAKEMEKSLVGQPAPDVRANDPEGNPHSIYELDADYIIVYMYNPTCEHCMKETPQLVEWYREWKNKGVEVFAIVVDTDRKEWTDYIRKTNMEWINVFDPTNRAIYGKYYVDITPELYVINPERKIIGKNLKTFQIETIINRDIQKRSES